jgi:tetratricopeptide (TPR) repeat protein
MKFLESIEKYTIYIVLALLPVFVLPFYTSPTVVGKEILLVGGICLFILIWVIRMVIKGSLSFSVGKFDLGVLLLMVAYLVSTFLATPNKMEAYLLPGTTTFLIGGAFLYFLINQLGEKGKKGVVGALFASGIFLSLSVLLASLGIFAKIPQLPSLLRDPAFNPIGGNVSAIILLAVFSVLSLGLLIKESDLIKKLFFGVSLVILLIGLAASVGSALPGKPQAFTALGMNTSWQISVDSLKASPFLGAGPANYLTAFNLFKPLAYNQTGLWQIAFTGASNFYFTLLTETGFLGLAALVVLLISVYKVFSEDLKAGINKQNLGGQVEKFSLVFLIVLFALLPVAPVLLVFLFPLLAIYSGSESKAVHLNVAASGSESRVASRVPSIIVGIPFLAGIIAVLVFGSKILAAEATYKQSLDALSKNDAKGTFDLMTKAVSQNQNVDRYHASLAQIDMALANSIASKKDITDADKTTVTQLIQAGISEGKATVTLNPSRSGNWGVLAQIYRSIMSFATGADQYATQTYTQAVSLDPINPNLRIALGGTYYALGNYDSAIDAFKLAVLAKSDLANAHYNLAIAYREKKDYDNAITEMNTVLGLVAKDSQDYTTASSVLSDLQKAKAAVKPAASSQNLTAPQPAQSSNIKPPLTLPQEATPPAATQQ